MNTNNLLEELNAFDPKWQVHYKTIAQAARAAKVLPMYSEWLGTEDGKHYQEIMHGVPDTIAQNEEERKVREALYVGTAYWRDRWSDRGGFRQ